MWAFAKEKSYKTALKEALEKEVHWRKEADALKNYIRETFTSDRMYAAFTEAVGTEDVIGQNIDDLFAELENNG